MKVVVTGGAGFLGQRLIRAVLQRGTLADSSGAQRKVEEVVAVDQVAAPVAERVTAAVGDVSDASFIAAVAGGADSVFHLAAVVSGAAEADFDLGMRVNLDGTRALLEALRSGGRRPRVVFASSVALAELLRASVAASVASSCVVGNVILFLTWLRRLPVE